MGLKASREDEARLDEIVNATSSFLGVNLRADRAQIDKSMEQRFPYDHQTGVVQRFLRPSLAHADSVEWIGQITCF
jgi:hypothetical protein